MAGRGERRGQFRAALHGLAVDASDALYAAGDAEIKVFDPGGAVRREWATSGPAYAVAVSAEGSVFVGEVGQIEIFDSSGRLTGTWQDGERLGRVSAIGFSGRDVLAADSAGRAIRRFDGEGRFLNDIGRNTRTQGFLIPNGVLDFSVDAAGVIHAANPGKHRIERYTTTDRLLGHFGRFGGLDPTGFSGCCNPTNVTLDRSGRTFVTEKAGPRAKVYDAAGNLLAIIAADIFDPNCKNMDIAVDSRGWVYVTDTVRLAIQVFAPEATDG
jgi:sugar lactone lactonase YvrE